MFSDRGSSYFSAFFGYLVAKDGLKDWYLQTIYFPRVHYIQNNALGGTQSNLLGNWIEVTFFRPPQGGDELFWPWIVLAVLLACLISFFAKRQLFPLAVPALAFLLCTLPNGCGAHMWWATATFGFGTVIGVCNYLLQRLPLVVRSVATFLLLFLVSYSFQVPKRLWGLYLVRNPGGTVVTAPPVYAGMNAPEPLAEALARGYSTIQKIRAEYQNVTLHPDYLPPGFCFVFGEEKNFHKLTSHWHLMSTGIYPDHIRAKQEQIQKACAVTITTVGFVYENHKIVEKNSYFTVQIPMDLARRCSRMGSNPKSY